MERKIGEIFEYNGECYQCIESDSCGECSLFTTECKSGTKSNLADKIFGECSRVRRSDNKHAIFKKLEKVGEPYDDCGTILQRFRIHTNVTNADTKGLELHIYSNNTIGIEIKQNKEDMEENKTTFPKEDNALTRTVYAYVNGKISDKELIKIIKEMTDKYPYNKKYLKPFDLEAAKAGKPVCTRDGRKARIICFDRNSNKPIVALITTNDREYLTEYYCDGRISYNSSESNDLMMLPEKKEGWVNVDKRSNGDVIISKPYPTRDEAIHNSTELTIDTVNIEWEE